MSKPIIEVVNISKRYRLGAQKEKYLSLRDEIVGWLSPAKHRERAQKEEFWALTDVNFSVEQGEAIGIIGRNGAGKSTLLKVLSQITPPTKGKIAMRGRVASLLEVGTGFHPELTGRENIFLNGAILGMTRKEIAQKFDEIVAFAEVEKFLDTPVKRYSSGMYVRLAFAVAAHLEPEILVVDEVLAVGDAAFQKKCLGKMGEVAKGGRTVLFVSHNMAAVEGLCTSGLVLNGGKVQFSGSVQEAVALYLSQLGSSTAAVSLADCINRSGNGKLKLRSFHIEDTSGKVIPAARSGMDIVIALGYECLEPNLLENVDVGVSLKTARIPSLSVLYSSYTGRVFSDLPREGVFRCRIPKLPLGPGTYFIGARVMANEMEVDYPHDGVGQLQVVEGDFYNTGRGNYSENLPLLLDGEWDIAPLDGIGRINQ